ncbi:hypothetical protein [Bradyrhizobium japonicum]|uniref:hypothetical protein n=1 Tax=Bradyrhizobium japonicum TaxID=375 RepID=UPI0011801134|nr:hypothetical protein [Bradyrhizobium japonicum]
MEADRIGVRSSSLGKLNEKMLNGKELDRRALKWSMYSELTSMTTIRPLFLAAARRAVPTTTR